MFYMYIKIYILCMEIKTISLLSGQVIRWVKLLWGSSRNSDHNAMSIMPGFFVCFVFVFNICLLFMQIFCVSKSVSVFFLLP